MPRFEPFAGLRYDLTRVDLGDVIAPPYDVIDEDERTALESRSEYNAVRVELAREEPDRNRHTAAASHLREWLADGVLAVDPEPAFYVYRMGWHDHAGSLRQTTGVVGSLALSDPDAGEVLPHERTMPKPLGDRLDLLRACRTNLSPIWCLSPVSGLTDLLEPTGPPVARATDDDGVHHRLWRITRPAEIAAVTEAVGSAPLVIADGHHRYQTALAYRAERNPNEETTDRGADMVMALVVELRSDQLGVEPIHRIIRELAADVRLPDDLEAHFEVTACDELGHEPQILLNAMRERGSLVLVNQKGSWLLKSTATDVGQEPDSALLAAALSDLGPHDIDFHHSAAAVIDAVERGEAEAGVLLRAVSVDQIAEVARAGKRMPEKTTFFTPKPRTGLVFRSLD